MPVDISDIEKIVVEQDEWRGRKTINIIASENSLSPAARSLSISDFGVPATTLIRYRWSH